MTLPTIHLNGTPGERLLDQVTDAGSAVYKAIEALSQASPNARDYYPQGPGAFAAADDEHTARCVKLREVFDELQALAIGISDAIDERGGRR